MSVVKWDNLEPKDIEWVEVLKNTLTFGSMYKIVPTEGYLAWEYNPLRNYRLSENMYEKDGKYYTESQFFALNPNVQKTDKQLPDNWVLRESGELVDFITDELSFNLNHPVEILPQYSYDGSVNLILNDGLNIPRLVNSRFTVTGKNTYKVIDRKGDNDTNIYDQGEQFDVDTSLFKSINKIPTLDYLGTTNGNMSVGNYHFYFKYSDADGNESDWVAESGLVSLFMGNTSQSVNTGIRDENSLKGVRFKLTNIDIGYVYVKVYYTRYSADVDSNLLVSAKRIDKNFLISNSGTCNILIIGDENDTEVTLEEINSSFDVIQNAQTQCTAANRLFMANIHKSKMEYDLLSKLSLCFCPYKAESDYDVFNDGIDEQYNIRSKSDGYYDSKYIYDNTGYWPGELYRLGIVYIMKDGSLSPVFNIRGATNLPEFVQSYYKVQQDFQNTNNTLEKVLQYIDYSEEDFMIVGGIAPNENAKGVIQLSETSEKKFPVLGINITADKRVIEELKKHTKGFFFVRQKRMPLTLAQGITIGLDKKSRTPTLPTLGGVIDSIRYENSFVETEDINYVNFVSEGFLSRYQFNTEPDKQAHFWKTFGKIAAIVVILAAAAVASVFSFGAAAPAAVAGTVAAFTALGVTAGIASVATITAITAGAAMAVAAGATLGVWADRKIKQRLNKTNAKAVKGRYDPIPKDYHREEQESSRQLTHFLSDRYIITDDTKNSADAFIVPDYQVNQPYYNQLFTGDEFTVKLTYEQPATSYTNIGYFDSTDRHFYVSDYNVYSDNTSSKVKLVGVPDGCPVKMIGDNVYRARAGYPEEAYKYEFIGNEFEDSENRIANSDIVRGNFGSYVGVSGFTGHVCDQVNIMIPGYQENKLYDYIKLRMQDTSAFYAISDRIDIKTINSNTNLLQGSYTESKDFEGTYYRGDCYICQYTHRIVRNFNDPSAPYNDKIVDPNNWKENYDPDKPENYANINLGDVNAVQLGLWLTFRLRSSYNLNVRTIDKSHVDEYLMSGNYRSFYPNYGQLALGSQKIPDSDQYNKGFTKSVSEKYYFEVPDVPYIKQEFQNRIVFSDIHINDAYKNGFRVLRTTNHKDYPMTYGSITKLIEVQNALLVVFEHGIGIITINNSAEHSSQVLSELKVISDTYGSQWKDSIIKTPNGVYGVDTVAKKIWRVKNGVIELISDFRVQEFLNQNITLSERETTPIIGVRNVKTLYNAFKQDVMFTFYDNLHGIHEKSWNLCWNELLEIFTTFYSWIPSEMPNIDNIPFSFDRSTVKAISKLGVSDHGNDFSDGVTLSNNVLDVSDSGFTVPNKSLILTYFNTKGELAEFEFDNSFDTTKYPDIKTLNSIINKPEFIGFIHLDNRVLPDKKTTYRIEYELLRDNQQNHTLFSIITEKVAVVETQELLKSDTTNYVDVSYLVMKDIAKSKDLLSELYWRNKAGNAYADIIENKVGTNIERDNDGNIISYTIHLDKPIFKNTAGKRLMLDENDQINPDKIVRYLNIKAKVFIGSDNLPKNATEAYYSQFANGDQTIGMIDAGYFESQVAITTTHNLSLLSTDFWKHGQAGIIDIKDKIYPTYWYGKKHPFEFECVVVDDPSVHKIFTNLELVANNVKPESFHYEIIGDTYDFAEDKPTMYFRQEALKALYQYNGYDIEYNPNFLEIEPKQHNRSADFPKYYSRWDTINEIYDSYKRYNAPGGFNYDHLAGAEIVYYPTRNEFRVWNHVEAMDADSKQLDKNGMLVETSVIKANCRYLEDKWLVSINPIVVTYKNEIDKSAVRGGDSIFTKDNLGIYKYSTWVNGVKGNKLPPINIQGTKLEQKLGSNIEFPGEGLGKDNALYGLYDLHDWKQGSWRPIDPTVNKDRRETDVRGKFMKVRIRYSGKELAIIDFLNTIYQISYA